jgi:pimeloyl-ACP methyl ester carboxylesterase
MFDAGTGLRSQQVGLPDGRTMRTVVAGSGDPLVVFEGGIAVCASMWMTVQRSVAEETRTFAYDRAGCGGSDDDPRPRSLQRMADDLAAVLAAAGLGGSAVLVGASLGAPILQLFARAIPGEWPGSFWSTRPSGRFCGCHRFESSRPCSRCTRRFHT